MTNKILIIQYVEHDDYGCFDMYFDEAGNFLDLNYDNDADWRHEYFDPIFDKIGVTIKKGDFPEEYINNILEKLHEQ